MTSRKILRRSITGIDMTRYTYTRISGQDPVEASFSPLRAVGNNDHSRMK